MIRIRRGRINEKYYLIWQRTNDWQRRRREAKMGWFRGEFGWFGGRGASLPVWENVPYFDIIRMGDVHGLNCLVVVCSS